MVMVSTSENEYTLWEVGRGMGADGCGWVREREEMLLGIGLACFPTFSACDNCLVVVKVASGKVQY